MAKAQRLVELGMPPALALEVSTGGAGTPGPEGPRGPAGPQGPAGPAGPAPANATTTTAGVVKQAANVAPFTGTLTTDNAITTAPSITATTNANADVRAQDVNLAFTGIHSNITDIAGKVNAILKALKDAGIMA